MDNKIPDIRKIRQKKIEQYAQTGYRQCCLYVFLILFPWQILHILLQMRIIITLSFF